MCISGLWYLSAVAKCHMLLLLFTAKGPEAAWNGGECVIFIEPPLRLPTFETCKDIYKNPTQTVC